MAISNIHNFGYVAGSLYSKPEIKHLDNGAYRIYFTVVNKDDPNDKNYPTKLRANRKIKVTAYVHGEEDISAYEKLEKGDLFACTYWVDYYTLEDENGEERFNNYLSTISRYIKTAPASEALGDEHGLWSAPPEGLAKEITYAGILVHNPDVLTLDDVGDEILDMLDEVPGSFYTMPKSSSSYPAPKQRDPYDYGYDDYTGPDYDFMQNEDIEEMARYGDREAQWYGETYRGLDLDYDPYDDYD